MIEISAEKVVFSPRQVEGWATDRAKAAVLSAAKYLHKSVRHSIRVSKRRPSAPGTPPHTRSGALKDAVSSSVSPDGLTAEVGVFEGAGMGNLPAIAVLHEFGGRGPVGTRAMRIFRVGGAGPIDVRRRAVSRGSRAGRSLSALERLAVFAPLRTPAQAARANAIANALQRVSGEPVGEHDYPRRSFLAYNLERLAPKILAKFGIK